MVPWLLIWHLEVRVFEALGDLQRGQTGDKDHLTNTEMRLHSGNGQGDSDLMKSRSSSC